MKFKTYADLSADIAANLHKLPPRISLVVGIPRSGMIPAYMLGFYLNTRVCSLPEFIAGINERCGYRELNSEEGLVLVVDDSCDTGRAMADARAALGDLSARCQFWVVYRNGAVSNKAALDGFMLDLPAPRMFQWNYLNHWRATQACYDIDGVLCHDPLPEQNDDGERYLDFVRTARPLFVPSHTIKAIVTSRLEKYREVTESWLKENGVRYEALYMLDATAEERRQRGLHAVFKAKVYEDLKECSLFYESEDWQAREIFKRTRKPCVSVAKGCIYQTDSEFRQDGDVVARFLGFEKRRIGDVREVKFLSMRIFSYSR